MKIKLCFDFNGVIHDYKNPVEGKKMGVPIAGAEELNALYDDGYHIIIHTDMANTEQGKQVVADWLDYYDLSYNEIVGKPTATFYIDDHAVEFKDWPQTLKKIGYELD